MNKLKHFSILFLAAVCCTPTSTLALEIPDYIVSKNGKPINVADNICPIIKALSSEAVNSTEAEAEASKENELLRDLASKVYAEAISTRVVLMNEKDREFDLDSLCADKGNGEAEEQKEIMTKATRPLLISIARRLQSIAALEAGIASLEGTQMFKSIPKGESDVLNRCSSEEKN